MPSRRRARTVCACAMALGVLVAGCSGQESSTPRLVVGNEPPPDEWGDLPRLGDDRADDRGTDAGGAGEDLDPPPSRPASGGGGGDDEGPDDEDGQTVSGDPLAVFEPLDGATFRVVDHAKDADWSSVLVSADAGDWMVVVDDGAGGEYPVGSGDVARPDSWTVTDGATLAFCDRSATDGVTGTYVEVRDLDTERAILRERIQGTPC